MPKAKPDYETLTAELDSVLGALQRDDLGVDEALKKYQRGLELVRQLEAYLQSAENTITELKAKFNADSA
jgi:exodeoxyribonuclease VII small subunit